MSGLTVFGTTTSPYVRRVRIVAAELGVDVNLVDTFRDDGQAQLRALNPLWKVPTAKVGELVLFDSRTICTYLLANRGPGELAHFAGDNLHALNLMAAIDGAVDSLINAFYLQKDGVSSETSAYLEKQVARAESAMNWLEQWATGAWLSTVHKLGLPEIALVTTLDWMRFRNTYDVSKHPKLVELAQHWSTRDSFVQTLPG